MALPIIGPINKTPVSNADAYYQSQGFRQAKPIDRPLGYRMQSCYRRVISNGLYNAWANSHLGFGNPPIPWQTVNTVEQRIVRNLSYEKLKASITDQSMWAVNLAEYHQSLAMMAARFRQILSFTNHIRKGNFLRAAEALGYSKHPSRVSLRRRASNNWLEYSFGWKPLIEDIHSAVDHLQTPIKTLNPKGSASTTYYFREYKRDPIDPRYYSDRSTMGLVACRQGCKVSINNPNLYLANSLGLANPAVIVWELIPFSFVVDWFANVGEFLSQGTDFLGLTVTQPWNTTLFKGRSLEALGNPYWASDAVSSYSIASVARATALTGVEFTVRPARLWGWQRAANAAAVTIQALGRLK